MLDLLASCELCPRNCKVNRLAGQAGFCQAPVRPKLARAALHHWEEPCISGSRGSGTVFFSHCNLKCLFCQNYRISQEHFGYEISEAALADIFLQLEQTGAHNINLVSPTPYIPSIAEAIILARRHGLQLPIIYNSNGYESAGAIARLSGLVNIYLPDLKYYHDQTAARYSAAPDYFKTATGAIREMYAQVGPPEFDSQGIIKQGLIIRHLLLPEGVEEAKLILDWINENLPREVYVSLMAQYFPTYRAKETAPLNRRITKQEYENIIDYFCTIGLENGYVQERSAATAKYVPVWDGSGVSNKI